MSTGCTTSTTSHFNDYYYDHHHDHSYCHSDVYHNGPHDCKNSAEPCCTHRCPRPCCEGKWPVEDWNWAVVNSYKYLFIAEKRLTCNYDTLLSKLHYGYKCDIVAEDTVDRVKAARNTIKREIKRYKYKVKCLCTKELRTLFELIERFEKCETAATNVQILTDENWVKQNLLCASREDWEMYASALCALLKIEFSLQKDEDTKCNIAFEITKSQQFCDFIISLAVVEAACKMGLQFDVEKQQCKIEWELLLEKNPTCNLELKTYISCKEQGITYDLIQLLIDAGLDIQSVDGELFILGLLQSYKLNSLSFSGIPARTEETESFYSDPKAFVERYLREYHLSELMIKKIIEK